LLEDYTGYTWWPGLPPVQLQHYGNCEFFSLFVDSVQTSLRRLLPTSRLEAAVEEAGLVMVGDPSNQWSRVDQIWFTYAGGRWDRWDALDLPFPMTGTVRQEYDYQGADAIARVQAELDRFTPGADGNGSRKDSVTWTAAAKPFGYLDLDGTAVVPSAYGFVLPAFREVRLMPIDAASMPGGGSFDLDWRRHIVEHLPVYMERGPSALNASCWYCAQLVTWEVPAFRQEGVDWLRLYSDRCLINPPGGGGHGGGSRHAH
jgi:hypothetical protein